MPEWLVSFAFQLLLLLWEAPPGVHGFGIGIGACVGDGMGAGERGSGGGGEGAAGLAPAKLVPHARSARRLSEVHRTFIPHSILVTLVTDC